MFVFRIGWSLMLHLTPSNFFKYNHIFLIIVQCKPSYSLHNSANQSLKYVTKLNMQYIKLLFGQYKGWPQLPMEAQLRGLKVTLPHPLSLRMLFYSHVSSFSFQYSLLVENYCGKLMQWGKFGIFVTFSYKGNRICFFYIQEGKYSINF